MICDVCGKQGARIRKVARTYGKGKDILVIENVPVVICPHCGESYLEADTLHKIERIKLHKKSFAVKRSVPVATHLLKVKNNAPHSTQQAHRRS